MKLLSQYIDEKLVLNKNISSQLDFGKGKYLNFDIDELLNSKIDNKHKFNDKDKKLIYNQIPQNSEVYFIQDKDLPRDGDLAKLFKKYPNHFTYGIANNQVQIYKYMKELPNTTILLHLYQTDSSYDLDTYIYKRNDETIK